MAFNALLWSFSKKENSTARPVTSQAVTVPCVTNDDFDLVSPTLIFNFNGGASNPTQYNYCYLGEYKRYYWIDSWSFTGGQWVAYCSVDVLASWRTEIGNTTAYVLRAAAAYDGNIQDNIYPAKMDVVLDGDSVASPLTPTVGGVYIVGTVSDGGMTDYYEINYAKFKYFTEKAFSDDFYGAVAAGVEWMAKAAFDPLQYLRSVMYIPFPVYEEGRSDAEIRLGWWGTDVTGNAFRMGKEYTTSCTLTVPKHPQAATRGAYLNCAPYSSYVLDCRPWGRIVLDSEILKNESTITLDITVDAISGVGTLTTEIDGGRRILAVAQVGQPVQLSQVTHDALGAVTSVVAGVASAAAGNAIGAVASIGSAVDSVAGKVSTLGVNGSVAQMKRPFQLDATFLKIVDENNEDLGRPLMQKRKLNTLAGYQRVSDPEVVAPCTHGEALAIRSYLEGGYHYE